MSMSIYYTAKRNCPLNNEEKRVVQTIVDKYCSEFPLKNKHEDFCLYSEPFDEQDTVLDGATTIPMNMKIFYDVILYWLKCLSELTEFLSDCEWNVHLDDVDLIWESPNGWRVPTDEEMRNNG